MKHFFLFSLLLLISFSPLFAQDDFRYSEEGLDSLIYTDPQAGVKKILLFQHKTEKRAKYVTEGDKITFSLRSDGKKTKTKGLIEKINPESVQISGKEYPLTDIRVINAKATSIAFDEKTGRFVNGWGSFVVATGGGMMVAGGSAAAFIGLTTLGTGVGAALLLGTPLIFKRNKLDFDKWNSKAMLRDLSNNKLTDLEDELDPAGEKVQLSFRINDLDLKSPVEGKISLFDADGNQILDGFPKDFMAGNISLEDMLKKNYTVKISARGYKDTLILINKKSMRNLKTSVNNIELIPEKKEIQINISDIETNEKVNARVILTNKNRNEKIEIDPSKIQNGSFKVMVRTEDEYELEISNTKGYFFFAGGINSSNSTVDIKLTPFKVGAKIQLNNISFASGSYLLNDNAIRELNRVIDMMRVHPTARIEIAAHTDDLGTEQQNLELSQQRAKVVFDYLIGRGLASERFVCKGYGSSVPLVPNDSDANRAINRRFELIIVGL